LFGVVDYYLAQRYKQTIIDNMDYLAPVYKEKYNIDLREFVDSFKSGKEIEE